MAYNITLSNKNKEIAESLLLEVVKSLDSLNIEYWLEGGTLLGIKRESRLLPWDNDLDLSINNSQINKIDDFTLSQLGNSFSSYQTFFHGLFCNKR
mgnify:CR=1 FL=1